MGYPRIRSGRTPTGPKQPRRPNSRILGGESLRGLAPFARVRESIRPEPDPGYLGVTKPQLRRLLGSHATTSISVSSVGSIVTAPPIWRGLDAAWNDDLSAAPALRTAAGCAHGCPRYSHPLEGGRPRCGSGLGVRAARGRLSLRGLGGASPRRCGDRGGGRAHGRARALARTPRGGCRGRSPRTGRSGRPCRRRSTAP
jgi:hypothetical protein